ncbi:MAG TPA: RNA methyltransferase substrate-binding domain-containing protein, partial [Tepidisphaeraceae bacterium]|nr:RNA methyltransferase substrate-binding domain-containing protein [Tepidisphaeraceae bacterium]
MPHIEGAQSVLAALAARRRKISVVLVRHDASKQNVREVIELAEASNVPVRHVDGDELDKLAHGTSHGGVIAISLPVPKFDRAEFDDL